VGKLTLADENGVSLNSYRFNTLDFLGGMAGRGKILEEA
jgi:hypothetical protein